MVMHGLLGLGIECSAAAVSAGVLHVLVMLLVQRLSIE